jgi:hypothetical protein
MQKSVADPSLQMALETSQGQIPNLSLIQFRHSSAPPPPAKEKRRLRNFQAHSLCSEPPPSPLIRVFMRRRSVLGAIWVGLWEIYCPVKSRSGRIQSCLFFRSRGASFSYYLASSKSQTSPSFRARSCTVWQYPQYPHPQLLSNFMLFPAFAWRVEEVGFLEAAPIYWLYL